MSQLGITGMTISISVSDKDYGKGNEYFANLTSKTPEESPIPLENIEEVIDQGLKMYLTAFQTILAGRFSTGNLAGPQFKEMWAKSEARFNKVHKFLTQPDGESHDTE